MTGRCERILQIPRSWPIRSQLHQVGQSTQSVTPARIVPRFLVIDAPPIERFTVTMNLERLPVRIKSSEDFNKATYLEKEHVKGLVDFIGGIESTKELGHTYKVEFPAWAKVLREKYGNDELSLRSLSHAFDEYFWPVRGESDDDASNSKETNYAVNKVFLEELSTSIQNGLKDGDNCSAFHHCIKIVDWGGVYRGVVRWVVERYEADSLCEDIKLARDILDGEEMSGLQAFTNGKLRMDSGLTKVYALASSNSIIYDDRVGAGLGLLAKKYLKSKDISEVPAELNFMPGRAKRRNPSEADLRFTGRGGNPSATHARSNLMANWLVSAIVKRLNQDASGISWDRRKVEAALFMIGYSV